ncbi:hypothetical protein ACFQ6K_04845, partial [Streptomyces sp. NPDC056453]
HPPGHAFDRGQQSCRARRPAAPLRSRGKHNGVPSSSTVPAQRRADGPLPGPGDLVRLVRERAAAALRSAGRPRAEADRLARDCELAVRLALSCLLAPAGEAGVTRLVRDALTHHRQRSG